MSPVELLEEVRIFFEILIQSYTESIVYWIYFFWTENITLNSNEVAMKRQRAKSMFDEPAKQRGAGNNKTLEYLHLEFSEKYQSMNRGLKPSADRQLREPAVVPESRKIFEELKAILRAKNAKKWICRS